LYTLALHDALPISSGPQQVERFNGVPSINIQGSAAPGFSTGDAMDILESLSEQLPRGLGYEWTGLSYQEKQAGSQAPLLYMLTMLVGLLCLAALYDSWSIAFSVMLVVAVG